MRTLNLIPTDTLRKTSKTIVNRNPKESNNTKIPSEAKTYGKPLNIIEGMEEWTFVQSKCSKKNGKESQGKKKTEEGLMEPKRTGRIRGQIRH
jgi:hypothetical protein